MTEPAQKRKTWRKAANTAAVLLGLVACYPLSGYFEAQTRAKVARARTDMRSLATALEGYAVDCMRYPAFAVGDKSVNGALGAKVAASALPSFRLPEPPAEATGEWQLWPELKDHNLSFMTLTTPVAYITAYSRDPFSPQSKATFVYWSVCPGQADPSGKVLPPDYRATGIGWILVSPGPDGDYDLANEWDVYDPTVSQPSLRLLAGTNKKGSAFTYDPTNGTVSNGDIWRVKQ